jgi:hypothetical protein
VMVMSSFAPQQRARAIAACLRGNTPVGMWPELLVSQSNKI